MAKRKNPATAKPHWNMRNAELQREAKVFKDAPLDAGSPLTEAEAAEWERQRAGKPRRQPKKKHVKVLLSLDYKLLARADTFATERHLSRSALVAYALTTVLPSTARPDTEAGVSTASSAMVQRLAEQMVRELAAAGCFPDPPDRSSPIRKPPGVRGS